MKNRLTLLIGVVVVIVLLAYMFMFQVRYDEWAIVSTFGKTTESSVKTEPDIYFKWLAPIQKVTKYSKLVHLMDDELEEVATRDNHVVIIKTYLAWRVDDPLAFSIKLGTVERAETRLTTFVRDTRRIFSQYNFSDIVNPEPAQVRLAQMEQEATEELRQRVTSEGYGLKIEQLGIRRILVPERVTESVFDRMKQEREVLAADAKTSGEAEAKSITEEAKQKSEQILSFAKSVAGNIEREGDVEAAEYLEPMEKDPALAIFLRWNESVEKILRHRTTFVLSTGEVLSPQYLLGAREHALRDIEDDRRRAER